MLLTNRDIYTLIRITPVAYQFIFTNTAFYFYNRIGQHYFTPTQPSNFETSAIIVNTLRFDGTLNSWLYNSDRVKINSNLLLSNQSDHTYIVIRIHNSDNRCMVHTVYDIDKAIPQQCIDSSVYTAGVSRQRYDQFMFCLRYCVVRPIGLSTILVSLYTHTQMPVVSYTCIVMLLYITSFSLSLFLDPPRICLAFECQWCFDVTLCAYLRHIIFFSHIFGYFADERPPFAMRYRIYSRDRSRHAIFIVFNFYHVCVRERSSCKTNRFQFFIGISRTRWSWMNNWLRKFLI